MIGYTWVGVERWEKNLCRPKPGVLWHLCSLYCVGEEWFAECFPDQRAPRPGKFPGVNTAWECAVSSRRCTWRKRPWR